MTTHSGTREPKMSAQPMNRYKADLRDVRFLLWEQFKLQDLLGKEPYGNWGREEVDTVLDEVLGWVTKYTGPYNAIGDSIGCTLEDGKVKTPPGFKEAWKALHDAGWRGLSVPEKHGGQQGPFT